MMKNGTDFILIYRFKWAKLNTIKAQQKKGEHKKKKYIYIYILIGYDQINWSRIWIVIKLRFLLTYKV